MPILTIRGLQLITSDFFNNPEIYKNNSHYEYCICWSILSKCRST
jgi:hypothetical protein